MTATRLLAIASLAALVAVASTTSSRATARANAELEAPAVPTEIQVPEGNSPFLIAHALGTQNYMCLPNAAGTALAWTAVGPQATLYDDELEQGLTHFLSVNPETGVANATWQHSRDSSAVWAQMVRPSTDPDYVEAGAIPWLLLQVTGKQAGPTAGDRMLKTTYIQRVATTGGSAPAGTCARVGARIFVPYGADYVFYRAK